MDKKGLILSALFCSCWSLLDSEHIPDGLYYFFYFSFIYVVPHCMAYGILAPQPRIEPVPPAVEVQSEPLDHQGIRLPTHR